MSGHNDMHADDLEGQLANAIAMREWALKRARNAEKTLKEVRSILELPQLCVCSQIDALLSEEGL